MSPLERRYRRLLRLLPADHRAARGEELLGLLLDLDDGRTRPSFRQSTGILGLALRQRLGGAAGLLIVAYLVAVGATAMAAAILFTLSLGTNSVRLELTPGHYPVYGLIHAHPLWWINVESLLTPTGLLAMAVAWILGARRVALVCAVLTVAVPTAAFGLDALGPLSVLLAVVLLVVALWWRLPPPGPRMAWLVAVPQTVAVGLLSGWWAQSGITYPVVPGWIWLVPGAIGAVAGAAWPGARPVWRRIALAVAGAAIGAVTTRATIIIGYGEHGWTLSLTAAIALCGYLGALARRRSRHGSTTPAGIPPRSSDPAQRADLWAGRGGQ